MVHSQAPCNPRFVWPRPATLACFSGGVRLRAISRGSRRWQGGVNRSNSTEGRIDSYVRSTLAYVQKEGRYMLGSRRGGHGRTRIRFYIWISLGGGSGSRRDSAGGIQSHARGGGSGRGAVFSALSSNM